MSLSLAGSGQISGFDAGLSGFGGLVAVTTITKTDTFSASIASGANSDVTDLVFTYSAADAANTLLITGYVSIDFDDPTSTRNMAAYVWKVDGTIEAGLTGDAASNRIRIAAGLGAGNTGSVAASIPVFGVFTPGDTSSHTYQLSIVNVRDTTRTGYVNRGANDGDNANSGRSASVLTLMEVTV